MPRNHHERCCLLQGATTEHLGGAGKGETPRAQQISQFVSKAKESAGTGTIAQGCVLAVVRGWGPLGLSDVSALQTAADGAGVPFTRVCYQLLAENEAAQRFPCGNLAPGRKKWVSFAVRVRLPGVAEIVRWVQSNVTRHTFPGK